ncbi:MAG: L-ribulose-5-phosphate 4-epimerase AraD [Rhodothermales bacterium]
MNHEALRHAVWKANDDIVKAGLVKLTWGNASGINREAGVVAIKPSGIPAAELSPEDVVLVSLESGETVDGALKPSSDTPTHLHLYRHFQNVGGIVHTHSTHAVAWAQANSELPCYGTTHADYFHGPVPITVRMRPEEIAMDYERNTGIVIEECFRKNNIDPMDVPAVLVAGHGPFAWGADVERAVECAVVLEYAARMAVHTLTINPNARPISRQLVDKHFRRKHGPDAYYGQDDA